MDIKASNQITLMNTNLVDAAKVATNYLSFSNEGLIVGDMTASTLGKNVLIDADGVDIRNGNTVLATFAADTIELGKNSTSSAISLCGDYGKINVSTDDVGTSLDISSKYINLISSDSVEKFATISLYGNYNARAKILARSPDVSVSSATDESWIEVSSTGVYISGEDILDLTCTNGYGSLHAKSWNVFGPVYMNSNLNMAGNSIDYVGVKKISISGVNKLLWSGTLHMSADQTIVLSEAISAQVNGIVLVFSTYNNSTSTKQNSNWNEVYIPKYVLNYYNTAGHVIKLASNSFSQFGFKYLYFTDTTIIGDDVNTKSGTSNGVTYSNTWFVLRYVIGV